MASRMRLVPSAVTSRVFSVISFQFSAGQSLRPGILLGTEYGSLNTARKHEAHGFRGFRGGGANSGSLRGDQLCDAFFSQIEHGGQLGLGKGLLLARALH